MDARSRYILILWGQNFEEVDTVVFSAILRGVGLRVKIVGIGGPHQPGIHGVVIAPDIPLGQALTLAKRTSCVIVPCSPTYGRGLNDDPRYRALIESTMGESAMLVRKIDDHGAPGNMCERPPPIPPDATNLWYQQRSLTRFAANLADHLLTDQAAARTTTQNEPSSG